MDDRVLILNFVPSSLSMIRFILFCIVLVPAFPSVATALQDTTTHLEEVTVRAYFTEQPLLRLTASAGVVGRTTLGHQQGTTLLPAINTVPGVRMEERSPGSYRLSLRGSLLRSPFGVRNVKVYLDEIPLTDAGGNTYINLLDAGGIAEIEVLKGPDGSLFGANSGGVVLIRPQGMRDEQDHTASLRVNGGSFGLFHEQLSTTLNPSPGYRFGFSQAYQRADGYRQHSAMKRAAFQTVQRWNYKPESELRLIALYSDLRYLTPGGLTEAQYTNNPKLARPATPATPGALEQQAGIVNQTLIGGLVHDTRIGTRLKHVATVFGSHTDFSNPFITNYEIRDEANVGFRTYLDYTGGRSTAFSWHANVGMEWQYGKNDFANYENHGGVRGDAMAIDALRSNQHFYFARFSADVYHRLLLETSLSLNYYGYRFRPLFPDSEPRYTRRTFDAEWMPRAALSYMFNPQSAGRVSVSRGYSPPTLEEVRASDQVINTALGAETGWNYEIGFRWQTPNRRVTLDGSVFYYRMEDAIVRQILETDAEFFDNAGGVTQRGIELSTSTWVIEPGQTSWLRGLQLGANLTLSKFRFGDYRVGNDDFTGNKLTGVPGTTLVSSASMQFPKGIGAYVMHNYTSAIPLNDANTVFANAYHVLQAKVTWDKPLGSNVIFQVFVGGDNLLNQRYSLGNDINAFGGRFFNAASPRNFYGGIALRI
ncbi:iron complex outermembrane recepter protein [Parapedobacter indicus]|uniref:Iron complex outermembrane recepter protein n=2 Tax=Parapedobacter indicus TaxID=1477437 RepID=A0A1I3DI44_9SPHI|nr:iron complex outermembrane receptor protein [Parapedobacter indicus]SFH86313.1 iron complex outermembrane recepter protein [Parapedobacter indicus]